MRVGAYLRVSSRSQDAATQRSAIERAAHARGDKITQWYSETASGKTSDRPTLKAMLAEAKAGGLTRLYVYKLDRLTRAGIRDTLQLLDQLTRYGVTIVSIADGIDPSGPMGEIVIAVLAWAAQIERLLINERITSARDRMRVEGRDWGRPKRVTDKIQARIAKLIAQGKSVREIAQHVGVPRSTVSRVRKQVSQKPPGIPATKKTVKRPKYIKGGRGVP